MSLKVEQQRIHQQRKDGRLSDTTLRPLSCEISCFHNCDGSSLWKSGGTSIMATVHGPIAPKQYQHENPCSALVSVVMKTGSANNTSAGNVTYEREYEQFLKKQLLSCIRVEQYPRCVISIIIQIINADGSVLAGSLHACLVALMDASIELNYLPIAVSCCCICSSSVANQSAIHDTIIPSTTTGTGVSQILLDPSNEEEHDANAVLVFIFSNKNHNSYKSHNDCNFDTVEATVTGNDATANQVPSYTTTTTTKSSSSSTFLLLGCHTTAAMKVSSKTILDSWSKSSRAVYAIQAFIRLAIEQKVKRESQTVLSS